MKKVILLVAILLNGCAPRSLVQPTPSSPPPASVQPPPSATPSQPAVDSPNQDVPALWISSAVPDSLRQAALKWGFPIVFDSANANLQLDVDTEPFWEGDQKVDWIYVLVTPFPTVIDGVSSRDVMEDWHGSSSGPFGGRPLLMDIATLAAFSKAWGPPAAGIVQTEPSEQLLDVAWQKRPSWAIVPFEKLDPRWKVLTVDGNSPIQKDFDSSQHYLLQTIIAYPLLISLGLH